MYIYQVLFAITLGVVSVLSEGDEKCCAGACTVEGEEKFYSIDDRVNNCGECCMKPEDYDLYHKFEKNLLPTNSTSICSDLHYNQYVDTVTHGAGPVKMTLDMYGPDQK